MIEDVLDLKIFAKVVETGSLSSAARELDMALAVVSKRLASLEKKLGVRLLERTTRKQFLTHEGVAFHERCVRILSEVQDAEALIDRSRTTVSGQLVVTAPRAFGTRYLAPVAARFYAAHPAVSVNLQLADEVLNLVESGIDVALRFGALRDSALTARQIAPNYRVLCASPAYVKRHGEPKNPAELAQHPCIVYGLKPATHWMFQVSGKPVAVKVRGTFITNDGTAAQALALEGAGIFFKSIWDVGKDIDAGRLVRVMRGYTAPSEPLHAVYLPGGFLAPRVRKFVEFAIDRLREAWKWGPIDRDQANDDRMKAAK
jgi:DNA-binding transcriptional LysR family regulator